VATAFDSRFWATQLLSRTGYLSSLISFMLSTPGKFRSRNTRSATPAYYSLFPSNKTLFPFHTALLTVHLIKLWKFKSSGMLRFVLAWIISKDLSAFIFRVKQSKKKTGWLDSAGKGTTKLRELFTQKKTNIPEDLNLQQHRCENLKCRTGVGVFYVMYIDCRQESCCICTAPVCVLVPLLLLVGYWCIQADCV